MSTNVNTTTNTIVVQNANQTITVVDNNNNISNTVNVTQPLVNVVEVNNPGPAGPVGPQGPSGSSFVTASWAINALTASFLPLSTYNITSSWAQSASQALTSSRAISSSYALTASYALNGGGGAAFPYSGSAVITGSLTITGSLVASGSSGILDTSIGALYDYQKMVSLDWGSRNLFDGNENQSLNWGSRILYETTNEYEALNYSNDIYVDSQLYYRNIIPSQVQRSIANTPSYAGQIIEATFDTGVGNYQLVSLQSSGLWAPTKALVGFGADRMLGICVNFTEGLVMLEGDIGASDDNSQGVYIPGANHGVPIYVSAATGELSITPPSGAGFIVRVVGHIYYQSATDTNWWIMKFRPSNDWYEQ